ncbi:EAL domain-containing protein [Thiobacillus sp. 65-1402]|uniref:putative bifunctional diguanylate cyclase/phosphodiesterase n=2 Tax=Thiobacillus TaxID=919 RepID=UPI0025EA9896|nr:EAL domain-containing protein [Thiobacillus sp. 65-1402]
MRRLMRGIWPWLLVLGGVLTGLTFTLQVVRSADAGMRVQFLTEARLMQRSLDWTAVKALRGEASDAAREEYARLKRQLEALRSVSPQYRFVYLLGWHDAGEVRFLVDSEPADSSDFSPSGTVYGEATEQLVALFSGNRPMTEGPLRDSWGVWVSALVPHVDPQTGQTIAVLGLDVDASQWRRTLLHAAMLPLGATLVFMLTSGLLFYMRARARREHARLMASEGRLYEQAYHDSLTGLPNQRLLADRMTQTLAHAHRMGSRAAILFLDLDRFKNVNDSLGHAMGDALLCAVAGRLRALVREDDTVARLGGDEFVILLPEIRDDDDARHVAEKIIAELAKPIAVGDQSVSVGVSVGIALYPDDALDAEGWLACADRAMYAAKDGGRNTFQFADPLQNARARERLSTETGLRQGLARGEFELFYQPVFSLAHGALAGVEALVRWRHPEWGWVEPARFIPVAEDSGLIVPLGDWILAEACRAARRWHKQGAPAVPVMVNVSALQLRRPGFEERLGAVLQETELPPALLELELTESAIMQETLAGSALLHRLAEEGVGLAIDDFGTGYSSLAYLRKLDATRLKIDRSFVADMAEDAEARAIVASMVGMARALGLKVTAEGVESAAQVELLRDLGCDDVQGYYFAPPLAEAALLPRLADWRNGFNPASAPDRTA